VVYSLGIRTFFRNSNDFATGGKVLRDRRILLESVWIFSKLVQMSNTNRIFTFLAGFLSLVMYDYGDKIKTETKKNKFIKATVMLLITLAYVKDVKDAMMLYTFYVSTHFMASVLN